MHIEDNLRIAAFEGLEMIPDDVSRVVMWFQDHGAAVEGMELENADGVFVAVLDDVEFHIGPATPNLLYGAWTDHDDHKSCRVDVAGLAAIGLPYDETTLEEMLQEQMLQDDYFLCTEIIPLVEDDGDPAEPDDIAVYVTRRLCECELNDADLDRLMRELIARTATIAGVLGS